MVGTRQKHSLFLVSVSSNQKQDAFVQAYNDSVPLFSWNKARSCSVSCLSKEFMSEGSQPDAPKEADDHDRGHAGLRQAKAQPEARWQGKAWWRMKSLVRPAWPEFFLLQWLLLVLKKS